MILYRISAIQSAYFNKKGIPAAALYGLEIDAEAIWQRGRRRISKQAGAVTQTLSKSAPLTPDLAFNVSPPFFASSSLPPTPLSTSSLSYSALSYSALFSFPASSPVLSSSVSFSSILFSTAFFSSENGFSKRIRTAIYRQATLTLSTGITFLIYKKQ